MPMRQLDQRLLSLLNPEQQRVLEAIRKSAERERQQQECRQLSRTLEWDQVSRLQLSAQREVHRLLSKFSRKP